MENKKVLGKIIPAVLVLVLALLLVITISSCSKSKKTPVGAIVDEKDYLRIDLANDETYSISKLEFYNKLRYVGYACFEDALYEAALSDYAKKIRDDIEANASNLENATYYKRFVYLINTEAYGTTDEDEIAKLKDKDKETKEKTFMNNVKQYGYDVDYSKGIYQKATFEYEFTNLVKREYVRSVLLEEIEDEDSENKITTKKLEEYFDAHVDEREDASALLLLFSSKTEITDSLKNLNLKFVGNKLYRVLPKDASYDGAERTLAEYEEYYDDFDGSDTTIAPLSDNEVLFEFARLYNYTYSYKPQLKFIIDGHDYLDTTLHPSATLEDSYSVADYEIIKAYSLEDGISNLLAQDNGNFDETPRLTFTRTQIDKMSSTLYSPVYSTYSVNGVKYNTPSSTDGSSNYLIFKLADAPKADYKTIKALADLIASVDNNASENEIKTNLEICKECLYDTLNSIGIINDDAKCKDWLLKYGREMKVQGMTGATAVIESTLDKENVDSIWSKVFEEMLTTDYTNEKLKDYLDDECKITIYDSLFEVQFAQNYDFYKTGNKQSSQYVLKVKVNDVETTVTAEDMFDRLEQQYGANEATALLFNQILKDKYYSKITDTKMKEYEKEYESILTYFAQGNSEQYGYSPAIGQKAFVNLYFKADNKKDAIFNMWVSAELQDMLLYSNPTDFSSTLFNDFKTLTQVEYNDYVNLEYNFLYAYTDDDFDGEADDWTKVEDTNPRKIQVKEAAVKLINLLNERAMNEFSNTNRGNAYNDLYAEYIAASKVSNKGNYGDGQPIPDFTTTSEKEAYYFAQFKAAGIQLGIDNNKLVDGCQKVYDLDDDDYEAQVKRIYAYMVKNHSEDLTVDEIFARKLEATDTGANIDKVTLETLFEYSHGYGTVYLQNTVKAPSFKFEEKDNSDTSTGSKVYPYSINEDDPFPVGEDGKPIDNTGAEDSLYNTTDEVSINQLILYVRESKDGVESLSLDVINAFKAYFAEQALDKYKSSTFRYYITLTLVKQYINDGKATINEELLNKVTSLANAKQESLFEFKENEFTTAWYSIFK